jgi:hypothetical protein
MSTREITNVMMSEMSMSEKMSEITNEKMSEDQQRELRLKRNREASRRFREKQKEDTKQLEQRLIDLKSENAENESRISYLQAENILIHSILLNLRTKLQERVPQDSISQVIY